MWWWHTWTWHASRHLLVFNFFVAKCMCSVWLSVCNTMKVNFLTMWIDLTLYKRSWSLVLQRFQHHFTVESACSVEDRWLALRYIFYYLIISNQVLFWWPVCRIWRYQEDKKGTILHNNNECFEPWNFPTNCITSDFSLNQTLFIILRFWTVIGGKTIVLNMVLLTKLRVITRHECWCQFSNSLSEYDDERSMFDNFVPKRGWSPWQPSREPGKA